MKAAVLYALAGAACSGLLLAVVPVGQPEVRPAGLPDKPAMIMKPVRNYRDVLAVIPKDLEPENARHWSAAQKEVANGLLKKKLVDTRRPATLRFKVHGVDSWPTMTVWSHLPADEGYSIRVFCGLWKNPDYLPILATLRAGDLIEMTGICDRIVFENLWHTDSLSICLREGTVTKLLSNGKPAPKPEKINLGIISAVYGSGAKFADVTDRVQSLLNEPGARFYAKPQWLGADPTPGWNKALVITYHDPSGKRRIFTTGENGEVSSELMVKEW